MNRDEPLTWELAVQKAEARGHDLLPDPPHSLSSMSRRTCRVCGKSVLGNGRTAYGSALEYECVKVGEVKR